MFHIMLILLPILIPVFIAFLFSLLLFSVFTLILSVLGGASTALFIKNRQAKKLPLSI